MSAPSFSLSEGPGGVWRAEATIGGKTIKLSTGTKDKDAARVVAGEKFKRKFAASIASKARWQQHHARAAAAAAASSPPPAPPARPLLSAPAPDGTSNSNGTAGAGGSSTAAAVRAVEINAKLRARGRVEGEGDDEEEVSEAPPAAASAASPRSPTPVEPDKILNPGERDQADDDDDEDEDDDEDDDEEEDDEDPEGTDDEEEGKEGAGEGADDDDARDFISEFAIEGALTGATKLGATIAKSDKVPILGIKKTPRHPNEPNPKALRFTRKRMKRQLARLMAPQVKISDPLAIAIGLIGIVASMSIGAEEVDDDDQKSAAGAGPGAKREARPAPAPPPAPAAAAANHADVEEEVSPSRQGLALVRPPAPDGEQSVNGRFR